MAQPKYQAHAVPTGVGRTATTATPPPPRPAPEPPQPAPVLTDRDRRRALLALGGGNTVEWYDWVVYGLLAAVMAPLFFPSTDQSTAVLSALAVFAAGFAARPLGAIALGTVADRIGRRGVMILSVGSMAAASFTIGLLPTYATIGFWAPVLLLVARLVQGVSTGIEAPLNSTYSVELAPPGRAAFFCGVTSSFVYLGLMLASLVPMLTGMVFGDDEMTAWAWRLPFLVGGVAGLLVLWLRRRLPETLHERVEAREAEDGVPSTGEGAHSSTSDVWRGVWAHRRGLLATVFVVGGAQAFNYGWAIGLPTRAQTAFDETPSQVFLVTTLLSALMLVMAPFIGKFADARGIGRAFVWFRLAAVPVVFLMLAYAGGISSFALIVLVGGVVLALNMALYNTVAASLMPQSCRATGVGLGYAVGVAAFGGTAPYLLEWLQARDAYFLFPVYVTVLALLSVVLYLSARRHGEIYVD